MEELINDYERKIKAVNELLEQQSDIVAIKRLETKRGCYRAFIVDLKRAMADADTGDRQLTIPVVSQQREQLAILALERISKAHSESFSAGVASEALYKIANCG
jgi:hypothetical protein